MAAQTTGSDRSPLHTVTGDPLARWLLNFIIHPPSEKTPSCVVCCSHWLIHILVLACFAVTRQSNLYQEWVFLTTQLTSMPASSRVWTVLWCPLRAARWSGVCRRVWLVMRLGWALTSMRTTWAQKHHHMSMTKRQTCRKLGQWSTQQ